MFRKVLLIVAVTAWPNVIDAAAWKAAGVDQFFVTPGERSVLRWQVDSGRRGGPVEYTIRDYWGKTVASGRANVTAEGAVEVAVKLKRGFYDLELSAAKRRFGLVSLPAYQGKTDPFFCIDSALSWLERRDQVREGLIRVLRRGGVAMSRERLAWGQINPADGSWNWEGSARYETVRRLHAKHGVEVLEMFHSTTPWLGRVGKYPDDLVGTAGAWREIARRWRPTWGAMEVWNEPDIFFGGNLPADQYVPLVKTIAYAFHQGRIDTPVVGGVFAHCNRRFLDTSARNGLLDCVDAVSFHTYARAPQMEKLIADYRGWLRSHGREAMPLWITECGRPWARGPGRPPMDQDALSALDITMKAIEARVCGITRHFPFVYPFFEERGNNFGLMGSRATPLRSMAAYTRLVSLLAHKRYLGDLRCDDATIGRARIFADDRETVAVLYTAKPDVTAKLKLGVPVSRVEGIDGRELQAAEDETVPVPDGLIYVWLDRGKLGDRLLTDTPAMRLWTIGRQEPPRRPAPSPIVLRFQPDGKLLESKSEGYRLLAKRPGKLPLCVRVFNLSEQPHSLTLKLGLPAKAARVTGPQTLPLKVPAEKFAEVTWEVDLSGALAAAGRVNVTVTAVGNAGPILPLAIDLARGE